MRPLSQADKVAAFKAATRSFKRDHHELFESGMTDRELTEALGASLGIFSGGCGPGTMHLTFQGAGLKIWASWHIHNHVEEQPLWSGRQTVATARLLYGISDPSVAQLSLF